MPRDVIEQELADAALKFVNGEISVEELTALAARISAAAEYVGGNVVGPLGVLLEEYEGLDIPGYRISLYHDEQKNLSTIITRWPGGEVEYESKPTTGFGNGYRVFEDAKIEYIRRLRRQQIQKYREVVELYGDDN
ncbi:MAG: hypothetical protein ACRDGA_07880 [Bacteroidota bacterium]